jgi:hypothetical protein
VTAIKKKDTAEAMHAQRLAYIGNRGAKDMLALDDLRKLSHLIRNSVTFLGAEAKLWPDAGRARGSFR